MRRLVRRQTQPQSLGDNVNANQNLSQRRDISIRHVKILYQSLEKTIEKGLEQTWGYMDACGAKDGHLVIFDRSNKSWDDKIFREPRTFKGNEIIVWGM